MRELADALPSIDARSLFQGRSNCHNIQHPGVACTSSGGSENNTEGEALGTAESSRTRDIPPSTRSPGEGTLYLDTASKEHGEETNSASAASERGAGNDHSLDNLSDPGEPTVYSNYASDSELEDEDEDEDKSETESENQSEHKSEDSADDSEDEAEASADEDDSDLDESAEEFDDSDESAEEFDDSDESAHESNDSDYETLARQQIRALDLSHRIQTLALLSTPMSGERRVTGYMFRKIVSGFDPLQRCLLYIRVWNTRYVDDADSVPLCRVIAHVNDVLRPQGHTGNLLTY